MIGRRAFITLLGGALTSRPFPANAQPASRMRTVGALIGACRRCGSPGPLDGFRAGSRKEG